MNEELEKRQKGLEGLPARPVSNIDEQLEIAKSRIGSESTDEETGETIQLTETNFNELVALEQSLKVAAVQTAMSLYQIKQNKLYLFFCDTFSGYVSDRLGLSGRQAYKYTQLADRFGQSPAFQRIMELPINTALALAKDDEFVDQVNSENSAVVDQILDSKVADLKKKLKKQREEVNSANQHLTNERDNFQGMRQAYETEIAKLKEMVNTMATERGLDPERLRKITDKQELLSRIIETEMLMNKHFGIISDAAEVDELKDAEIAMSINRFLVILADWSNTIHNAYSDALFHLENKPPRTEYEEEESDVPA